MCSETSNYPRVTIWDLGMASFGCFRQKYEQSQKHEVLGGKGKKNSHLQASDKNFLHFFEVLKSPVSRLDSLNFLEKLKK